MRHRIDALTSTRGIAALLVVVFHFGCTVFPFNRAEHFFRQGNLAVGYFFVLSGFVMYWTYQDRPMGFGDYMKRRIARIAPLYWFAMLLAISYPVYQLLRYNMPLAPDFLKHLAYNATFTQAYFPGNALTINSPAWTLSVEMFFYLLFPALLVLARRNKRLFLIITALVYLVSQAMHLYLVHRYKPVFPSEMHEFIFYHPVMHLSQFMLGMAGGYFIFSIKESKVRFALLLLFAAIVFIVNYAPNSISLHNGLIAPLFLLLVMVVALRGPALLKWRPLVFLGEISFGIYILQEPVHFYCNMWNTDYFHLAERPFFYSYLAFLLVVSSACYYIIEKPFRRIITG